MEPTATLTLLEISKWMRQWDIAFSGTRGADAHRFVRKVRRLRAMAPVADRDLLFCLPFYLKGLAHSWYEEKQPLWFHSEAATIPEELPTTIWSAGIEGVGRGRNPPTHTRRARTCCGLFRLSVCPVPTTGSAMVRTGEVGSGPSEFVAENSDVDHAEAGTGP